MLLRLAALAIALCAAPATVLAQSAPGWISYGYVPTAGQYRAAFASKQDVLTFTPLNQAGGTMQGKLYTSPSTVNGAGFSILPGIAPTAPINGDVWFTNSGLFARLNNQTITLAPAAGFGTMASQNAGAVAITGGSINNTTIGGTMPASGSFSTLTATTPLGVASGGSGASTAPGARANFGAAASGANSDITALTGLTTPLAIIAGGTGGNTAATARSGLGLNSAAAVAFRNRLINGSFALNQRAVASASTAYAAGAYTLDRWKAGAAGATASYSAVAGGDNTVSITAGSLLQVIEGGIYLPEGGTYTASWSGTATCRAYQGTATGSYVASPLTVTGWTAGTNGTLECQSGTLTAAQFEPGTQATAFERRDDELRRAQRYYSIQYANTRGYGSTASSVFETPIYFPVPMRTTPTVTGTTAGLRSTNLASVVITPLGSTAARHIVTNNAVGDTYSAGDLVSFGAEL